MYTTSPLFRVVWFEKKQKNQNNYTCEIKICGVVQPHPRSTGISKLTPLFSRAHSTRLIAEQLSRCATNSRRNTTDADENVAYQTTTPTITNHRARHRLFSQAPPAFPRTLAPTFAGPTEPAPPHS